MKQKKLRVDVERFHEEEVGIERGGKRLVELEKSDLAPCGTPSALAVAFGRLVNGRPGNIKFEGMITTSSTWTVHSNSRIPGLE